MLQRAASNAYSWWWASHIRTKQTKWIEQSLQDMEERVHHVLKLIEEDGDSFAKRAEMYYKKRPELISFVEESYRAYRALAERYDHISTELQNANNTIATVFPEQVQFAMDDEDEYVSSPRNPKKSPQVSGANVPKVPKVPNRDLKGLLASASKKLKAKKSSRTSNSTKTVIKSGLSEAEAVEEIDKLQKEILALQTVKEFVKSSYESGIAKYWEIENQITEKQEKVFSLQDEFSVGKVIEDDEARTLMAEAALKSCQQTLAQLEEKQERTTKEAKVESKRIESARDKIKSLKQELFPNQTEQENSRGKDEFAKAEESSQSLNKDTDSVTKERKELEALREKIKEHFDTDSKASLTVTELTEKMDELVNKVISLETSISSQTALLNRLRTETDDLQSQIKSLEDNKATLINGANDLTARLREMETKLRGIQDLNQNVERQNNNLIAHFTEARCSLDHLSEKLHSVKPDEEIEDIDSLQESEKESDLKNPRDTFLTSRAPKAETMEDKHEKVITSIKKEEKVSHAQVNNDANIISENSKVSTSLDEVDNHDFSQTSENVLDPEPAELAIEKEDEPNWQQVLLSGLEDRENILLTEYTAILQNYKDVKKELGEVEKKNQDSLFDLTVQLREMRSAIAKRDEEIQNLRQKLNHLHENFDGSKDLKDDVLNDRSAKPEETNQELNVNEIQKTPLTKKEDEEIKLIFVDEHKTVSPIEEKIQMNIDSILDENLDFWLRFSTSFHQIQKFKREVQDLQDEIAKLKEKEKTKQEGSTTLDQKSEVRAIYRHLREIQTELTVWLEQSALLKDELKRRFSSLCSIQEEITEAMKEGVEEDEMKFTNYQAAKFQGEVFNMKQETNKVKDELQTGLDHVSGLQLEIEKTLAKLNEEYGISGSKHPNRSQFRHSVSRSRVPLRSFIFGTKPKKQKHSIFSCMNPALHRKYHDLRAGFPM